MKKIMSLAYVIGFTILAIAFFASIIWYSNLSQDARFLMGVISGFFAIAAYGAYELWKIED